MLAVLCVSGKAHATKFAVQVVSFGISRVWIWHQGTCGAVIHIRIAIRLYRRYFVCTMTDIFKGSGMLCMLCQFMLWSGLLEARTTCQVVWVLGLCLALSR